MNSKIAKIGFLALAFACTAGSAQTAFTVAKPAPTPQPSAGSCDSFQSEVDKFIQAQDLRGTSVKSMKTMLGQLVSQGVLTATQVDSIVDEIVNIIYPKMKVAIEQCLRQNLSVEELRQINAFYATPAGKKLTAMQPALMEAGSKITQQPDVQMKIQQIMQKYLTK